MNSFPMIKKLGLNIWDYKDPHHHFTVDAEELERLLQSAQVVYGPDNRYWNDVKNIFREKISENTYYEYLEFAKKQIDEMEYKSFFNGIKMI